MTVQASSGNSVSPGERQTRLRRWSRLFLGPPTPSVLQNQESGSAAVSWLPPHHWSRGVCIQSHHQPSYCRETREGLETHGAHPCHHGDRKASTGAGSSHRLDSAGMILASGTCQALGTSWTAHVLFHEDSLALGVPGTHSPSAVTPHLPTAVTASFPFWGTSALCSSLSPLSPAQGLGQDRAGAPSRLLSGIKAEEDETSVPGVPHHLARKTKLRPEGKRGHGKLRGTVAHDHPGNKRQANGRGTFPSCLVCPPYLLGCLPPQLSRAPEKKGATVPSSTVLIFQILVLGISASGVRRCWYSLACLCLLTI